MTKDLLFDIEFTAEGKVKPLSQAGLHFLINCPDLLTRKQQYKTAVESGLHVRFATTSLRDMLDTPDMQCTCQ